MKRTDILKTATKLVNGDRQENYGDPYLNHCRIAVLWSVILEQEITPQQVALCMAQVKMSRLVHDDSHLDSYIDAAAYVSLAGQFATEGE